MAAHTTDNSWVHYLLTNPNIIGVIGWLGLLVTVIGLWIAIYQIKKTRAAAEATQAAAAKLSKAVFARERLLELTSAISLLGTAKDYISRRNFPTALIFIDLALQQCAQARELLKNDDGQKLLGVILRVKKVSEELEQAESELERHAAAVPTAIEVRDVVSELNAISAKLRYQYHNEGAEP